MVDSDRLISLLRLIGCSHNGEPKLFVISWVASQFLYALMGQELFLTAFGSFEMCQSETAF